MRRTATRGKPWVLDRAVDLDPEFLERIRCAGTRPGMSWKAFARSCSMTSTQLHRVRDTGRATALIRLRLEKGMAALDCNAGPEPTSAAPGVDPYLQLATQASDSMINFT